MPIGRPHSFALIGALVALTPGLALGGSVDGQVTSAIPVPALQDTVLPGKGPPPSLKVPSTDIAAAAQMLPNWPGTIALRKNSERALYRENPAPQAVLQAFNGGQPQTFEGVMVLARAYVSVGNTKAARSVLSPFWRTAMLETKDEAALIREFGTLIPAADHRFRMERMFYADRPGSAQRVAALAGAQQLADAWAAADKGDKNRLARAAARVLCLSTRTPGGSSVGCCRANWSTRAT